MNLERAVKRVAPVPNRDQILGEVNVLDPAQVDHLRPTTERPFDSTNGALDRNPFLTLEIELPHRGRFVFIYVPTINQSVFPHLGSTFPVSIVE
jgi:hypothetical protein